MEKQDPILKILDDLLEELNALINDLTRRSEQLFHLASYDQANKAINHIKEISAIQANVSILREKWSQIELPPRAELTDQNARPSHPIRQGLRTPNKAFHLPILRALVQLGGSAPIQTVLDRVHGMMKNQLNDYDYQSLPSSPHAIRWENNVQWARYELVKQGYLAADSPRGVWEITTAGRIRVTDEGSQMGAAEGSGEYHTDQFEFKNET
jgi:hypothetical protein